MAFGKFGKTDKESPWTRYSYDIPDDEDWVHEECKKYSKEPNLGDYLTLVKKYSSLLSKWNDMVDRINKKGGEKFLEQDTIGSSESLELTQDDIRRLLQLCHPDKHGGSELSLKITQKLNIMKKK